jgi:hypothetical protein
VSPSWRNGIGKVRLSDGFEVGVEGSYVIVLETVRKVGLNAHDRTHYPISLFQKLIDVLEG